MTKEDLKQSILQHALSGKLTEDFRAAQGIPGDYKYIDELNLDIPTAWECKKLGEVGTFINGYTPKKEILHKTGDIPYFKVSDMNTYGNEIYLKNTELYLKKQETRRVFKKNTIVYPKNGGALLTNKRRILKQDSIVDLNTGGFEYNNILLRNYIFLIFQKIDFNHYFKGTALPTLDIDKLKNLLIPLPPLDEQKAIVKKVESLFEKVDKLENLEEDLDQLREDLKESIIQYGISGHLTENFRKSQGQQIEYTEEDDKPFPIPTNWEWKELGKIAKLNNGEKTNNIKLPYLEAKVLRNEKKPTYKNSGEIVNIGDSVILVDGENSGEVFKITEKGYMGSTFKKLDIDKTTYEEYILKFILSYKLLLRNNKKGAAIPHLNKSIFKSLPIPLPPIDEQKEIVKKIENIFSIIDKIQKV